MPAPMLLYAIRHFPASLPSRVTPRYAAQADIVRRRRSLRCPPTSLPAVELY